PILSGSTSPVNGSIARGRNVTRQVSTSRPTFQWADAGLPFWSIGNLLLQTLELYPTSIWAVVYRSTSPVTSVISYWSIFTKSSGPGAWNNSCRSAPGDRSQLGVLAISLHRESGEFQRFVGPNLRRGRHVHAERIGVVIERCQPVVLAAPIKRSAIR